MERNNKPYSVEMNNVISNRMQDAYSQYSFSSAVQQLQNFENFRSFADAVIFYMRKHFADQMPEKPDFTFFKKLWEDAGIPEICSDRTWRNWKNGTWPNEGKKANATAKREMVFKIAFALSLTTEETEEFYQKAFFDRPLDAKSILDVVCYYCIGRNLPWAKVEELRTIIDHTEVDPDQKLGPRQCRILSSIQQDIDNYYIGTGEKKLIRSAQASTGLEISTKEKLLKEATEEELISHCVKLKVFDSDYHNMRLKVCAKKWIEKAKEKCENQSSATDLYDRVQILTNHLESDIEKRSNRYNSSSSLLNNVLGIKLYSYKDDVNTTKTSLKFMKKMIINQLPSPEILDQIEGETCNNTLFLRNTIILMSFYCFCVDNADDILKRINNELILSGTYPLYVGFPYDWMFVFSLYSNNLSPLDCFQALFDSAYEVEKIIKLNISKEVHIEKSVYDDLTDEQKELMVMIGNGDKGAKKELANSFLYPNEKQMPSLFEKVFFKFQSVHKTLYQGTTTKESFDDSIRMLDENGDFSGESEDFSDENEEFCDGNEDMSETNNRYQRHISTASYSRYEDSDYEKIFVSACIKAIESYDENYIGQDGRQTKLTSWIYKNCYIVFQHPKAYEKYIEQDSLEESEMAALIKEHTAKLDDMNRWIMEYRLGLTGPICNIFVNLRAKMLEEHSIEIDRDDIIAAERKLFRLMRLALAERRTKKDETR